MKQSLQICIGPTIRIGRESGVSRMQDFYYYLDFFFATKAYRKMILQEKPIFNRPCVSGAVLQTALSLVSHPFPPNLQDIINSRPLELESWHLVWGYPPPCVTCHMWGVMCQFFCCCCFVYKVVEIVFGGTTLSSFFYWNTIECNKIHQLWCSQGFCCMKQIYTAIKWRVPLVWRNYLWIGGKTEFTLNCSFCCVHLNVIDSALTKRRHHN